MIVAIFLILTSIGLICYEQHAKEKRRKINMYREIIYTDLNSRKVDIDQSKEDAINSIALGLGASGMNILDIYAATEEHSNVLEVLKYRFPEELGDFDSSIDWFEKVESLKDLGPSGTFASAYKGQMAENITMEYMGEHDFSNVGDFFDRNHPNDDVFGDINGQTVNISVKNGSVDYIKSMIEQHPDSNAYSINTEAYEEMLENGDIEKYASRGITIFSPGFSSDALAAEGSRALMDIHEAGDLTDNIPWVALALFGVNTIKNIKQYSRGEQSKHELSINIAVNAGRVATGGVFAAGGAKVGSAFGSFVAPGIGTLIGGGIGGIIGAVAGSSLFSKAKEWIKWGDIITAIDWFGEKYWPNFRDEMKKNMTLRYAAINNLPNHIESEAKLLQGYEEELNPYSLSKVSMNSVMVAEYHHNLILANEKLLKAVNITSKGLKDLCISIAQKMISGNKEKSLKYAKRLYGNIILSNDWILKNEFLTEEENTKISNYKIQLVKSPNHPYRLNLDYEELFDGIFYQTYDKVDVSSKNNLKNYSYLFYLLCLVLLITAFSIIF